MATHDIMGANGALCSCLGTVPAGIMIALQFPKGNAWENSKQKWSFWDLNALSSETFCVRLMNHAHVMTTS